MHLPNVIARPDPFLKWHALYEHCTANLQVAYWEGGVRTNGGAKGFFVCMLQDLRLLHRVIIYTLLMLHNITLSDRLRLHRT